MKRLSESNGSEKDDPRWCERCGCIHTQEEISEEKMLSKMTQSMADEIDAEFIEMIRKQFKS